MNDKQRDRLWIALAALRELYPDMRFGQMICNLASWTGDLEASNVWDVDDDALVETAIRHLHSKGVELDFDRMINEAASRALYALNGLLVNLRFECLRSQRSDVVSDGLDVAEHLARLIDRFGDAAGAESEFRRFLAHLAKTHPELGIGLARFDAGPTHDAW